MFDEFACDCVEGRAFGVARAVHPMAAFRQEEFFGYGVDCFGFRPCIVEKFN